MREFKKWYNQFNTATMSQTEKMLQQRAWKAALMWVLKADWNTPDELTELLAQELLNN
jgi:hypothetical protein